VKNVLYLSPGPQKAFASATDRPSHARSVMRMAVRVEHTMSKNQVLAGYLNVAYFGNSAYGIEMAAHRYFRTDASHLTQPQAALLVGVM
jgi:membrane peptidoglycan carboxypeptidase